jgi:hypothetical protein
MTATTPPPAEPVVPYGGPVTDTGTAAGTTLDLSSRSVAGTAGKWALRLLLPLVIRAIFRAIFR